MTDTTRPESITGGCLCGAIRFTITFPLASDWPPESNGVCHCTMCRKHSGSLLPQNCGFRTSTIAPPLASHASYKTYNSTSDAYRGFCSTCGSAMTFNDRKTPEMTEISLGCLDEEVLCGRRDVEGSWSDGSGRHVRRIGGWGGVLGSARYHIYCENEIPGVTDGFEGDKWLLGKGDGDSFRGRVRELKKRGDSDGSTEKGK